MSNIKDKKVKVSLSAIDPYLEESRPLPVQDEVAGRPYIPYGRFNDYPQYLLSLYEECSTLKAIIDGNVNYVCGDAIQFVNSHISQEDVADLLVKLASDWYVFGYAFVQVIRNPFGEVVDLVHLPAEWVRTDREHQSFWYSEKWMKRGSWNAVVYPAFMEEARQDVSVLMIGKGRGVYPAPLWIAAVKDVEMEKRIEEFHLNELNNNFLGSFLVNFNDGKPSDEERLEIERNMKEKLTGFSNAGAMVISYNNNVTNRTTVERLQSDNFDTRYQALASRTREQIFVAFKAQPLLFGLTTETHTGFSTTEFGDLFRLYNKTMISPVQDMFLRAFRRIFGSDVLTIIPFTI